MGQERRGHKLVVAGAVLAVLSAILGIFAAIPAIAIGVVLLTQGRTRAGTTIIVAAIVLPMITVGILVGVLGGRTFRAPSDSMEPTIAMGDRFVTTKASDPQRGDIVVFRPSVGALDGGCGAERPPSSPCPRGKSRRIEQTFVKRVVAVGGDRLAIREGRAVVDGRVQEEPFIRGDRSCAICNLPGEITVPEGHVFVMGDNRGESSDSRDWGPVPEDWVVGEVRLRYWPLGRVGNP